ncbi:hypothetical protein SUGI_1014910 [Cryptomeria japonica]|uniref:transcription termination factor MTERF9, chloroplastic-like n=1 Tax=Cryptomeria japonica TaxID=3369 RepID=UPI00241474D5|nr:transcription termination factor MTERF9, chloroplastic-like [Cryptomeria japonica]GLJ48067.1 hypothetical protein SUGI_1014910 [Cryptomeria japonica]
MNTMLCRKLFVLPLHFRNAYSTHSHSQNLFSHFASTRFNMSAAHITQMFKRAPYLQRLQTLDKVEQFVDMLNRCGCSEVQIAKIMLKRPQIISISAERILEPKIKLLEDFGFQGETLAKLLASYPYILSVSLENDLLPKMEFLKNLFRSQEFLVQFLLRTPSIFGYTLEKTLKPSVVFWERWGFQGTELFQLLRYRPVILQRSSLTPAQADLIREIGVDKGSKMFKYIVGAVATSRMETLMAKIENLKLRGLSAEEIWQLCRVVPQVLRYSKVRVSETMDFVVKDVEHPANYIVKHSWLLKINLEKVIRPRFLVRQKIKSMNGPSLSLSSVLTMTEARFVRNIIRGHPESTTLWTIYENAISNASNHTQSSIQC